MINEQIRDREIRLIGEDGEQLGIMSAREAMKIAQEAELDLVKIAPAAKPPVCKIIDYGKYKYEQARKEKEAKKKQKTVEVKEVRLSPNIDTNDLNTKINNAKKFISKGNKVKVTLRFRGREMAHVQQSKHILDDFAETLADVAVVEKPAKMEGRAMSEETIIRTAVVTGGSRGIGRAVCIQLAKQGCNVVVNYCHGEAAAAETVALCKAENADAVAVQADVSTAEGCKALFEQAVNAFGRVDILVNNAGITRDNLILRMSEEDFDAVLNANLKGAFLCCKEAARRMVRQRWGRIVNLSSVVALRGNAGQTNYAASKAGLIGLTKSLARELASRNVTVNAVAPGFIETDMTAALPEAVRAEMAKGIPAGRAGKPEDVANAVAFFAAEQSSYLTGQVLCADGGMAM